MIALAPSIVVARVCVPFFFSLASQAPGGVMRECSLCSDGGGKKNSWLTFDNNIKHETPAHSVNNPVTFSKFHGSN